MQENTVQESKSEGVIKIHGNPNMFQFLFALQIHLLVIFTVPWQKYHFSIRTRSAHVLYTSRSFAKVLVMLRFSY